jgi:hypothetical protein
MVELVKNFEDAKGAHSADYRLCKAILDVLSRHYGLFEWSVTVDTRQGMCYISLPDIDVQGYRIRLTEIDTDSVRKIVRFGGELLERYGIPRNFKSTDWVDGLAKEHPLSHLGLDVPSC